MNLRDRRQPEVQQPDMSESLQNWSDTTEKYKMLLAEQSGTICTQKTTIKEQEEIIRQRVLDMEQMEQNYSSQISKLKSEIQNLSDKIVKLNSADLVLKENQKLERQNEELQKSEREARENAGKEITRVKSEYRRKEQELNRLIEDAKQEKQKALTAHFALQKLTDQKAKRLTEDACRKLQACFQAKKTAMQGYVGVLTIICFVTTVLSVIRQKLFCEDVIVFFRELGKVFQVFVIHIHTAFLSIAEVTNKVPNSTAGVILKWSMVGLLWVILMVLIGFGMYKFWKKHGEDIRKGIDVWNCSVSVVVLVGLVYFGDYAKRVVNFNLFGAWLFVDVLLILAGWYVWEYKKYRGWC